jgi:hypothetical protein
MDTTAGGRNAVSLDSICSCKLCNHSLARDCINTGCSCCGRSDHLMVMDGIEGFLPQEEKNQAQKGG